MWAARTEATNAGTPCCGSPTAKLIGDLPGSMSPKSSRSRTKGERPTAAREGGGGGALGGGERNRKRAGRAAAAPGMSYHRCGEVKARLTIGRVIPGDASEKSEGPQLALGPPDGKGGAGSPP